MTIPDSMDTHKGVIAWFARNPVAANLLMLIIFFVGLGSAASIQKTMQPDFEINVVQISVIYPGASPDEVERGVVLKIEEALSDIDAIKSLEATSDESLATLSADIYEGNDINVVIDEIKSAIDAISSFPEEIERPVVKQVEFNNHAMAIQLSGKLDERGMKELAEEIKLELLQNENIAFVQINGGRDYEISIEVPEAVLMKYGLTLGEVADAIRSSSLDVPGGAIKTDNGNIMLRTKGQARRQHEFENITLKSFADGTRLTLADIANINDGFVEQDGFSYFDGKRSTGMQIFTVGKQDLIEVTTAAKTYLERKKATLPDHVELTYWADSTYYLEGRIDMMMENLGMGALLVFIVLGLFLNIKLAFWVMMGLPICFFGTVALLPTVDVSLNMMSLFGFILVLGIVVDDAIIIGESAYTESEQYGHSHDSVIRGALRVATPATFGVLTTIMAFSPTLFSDGAFSPFPESVGWVVILCLAFSLIESKWILPSHLAHSRPEASGYLSRLNALPEKSNQILDNFVERHYRPFIEKAIRYRYVTSASFLAMLIVTVGVVAGGIVRFVVIPEIPSDFIQANLEMVEGTADSETRRAYERINAALNQVDESYQTGLDDNEEKHLVKHVAAYGSDGRNVYFMVELSKSENRDIDGIEIARRWREEIGEIPGARVLSISAADNTSGPAVSLRLSSSNDAELRLAGERIEEALTHFKGLYDIRNSVSSIQDEIVLEIKPSAESLGLSAAMLGRQIRDAFYGAEAQRIQRDTSEIKVMVRFPEEQRKAFSDLQNMYIRTNDGAYVPLSSVANITIQPGFSKLTRIDSERALTISAHVDKEITEPSEVTKAILAGVGEQLKSETPSVKLSLSGESEESDKLMSSLAAGFTLALFGIFALLAIPLRSYMQPIIIMGVIPFGIIGAVVGHMLLGKAFSMMSFFGVIALSGVVVNDSLIMVDFINSAIARGESLRTAVLEAGSQRFRAILLTSLTTFFGLLPMLLESSLQAQMVIPMAISLGFGIIFATVITLILLPCLYVVLDDMKRLVEKRSQKSSANLLKQP